MKAKRNKVLSFVLTLTLICSLIAVAGDMGTRPVQASSGFSFSTSATSYYGGYNMSIALANNTGQGIESWRLELSKSDFTITSIWCAKISESDSSYIIQPESWNACISNGSTVSFGMLGSGTIPENYSYELYYSIGGVEYNAAQLTVTPTPIVVTPTPIVVTPTPIVVTPTPIVVTPTPAVTGFRHELNVSTDIASGSYTSDFTVNGFHFIMGGASWTVDSSSRTLDDMSFTKRAKSGGKGTTTKRAISFTATAKGTLTVYAMSGGSTNRALTLNYNGTDLESYDTLPSVLSKLVYQIPSAGTYVLYPSVDNVGIYYMKIEANSTPTVTQTPVVTPTPVSSAIPAGAKIVATDGSGDYKTVQAAISSVTNNSSSTTTIYVKAGTYKEVVTIDSGKKNVHIIGENRDKTIITYDNYNGKSNGSGGTYGTGGSASVFIKGSNIILENITISNSFVEQGNSNEQAVALSATGSQIAFHNCKISGNQDTLLCDGGTQYFYKCLIEGDVDFIFGRSQAYFENCEICSLDRGSSSNNGYITAARTSINETYGFVFESCKLTRESGMADSSVYLGRPWCPSGTSVDKAAVAYLNCTMEAHINSVGWTSMSGVSASHGRFYEYNSQGAGARVSGTRKVLTASQAANYTKYNVLKGWTPVF
ncbi:pectinesterase family protein [Anaeromicropila populeti]|uniref:Pectinesterase n=1 Tax=Anaeromicropila populeti TaxID=37658 RepID=A0A1I6LJT5_9FIRM|nr:pectinesterase family protein [Anaeromicropila populeti]SFS03673.1 Pectin methylesterase [Anaeromicropila populeti]